MALTILVTPAAGDIIQSSVWINEFNNIYNNPISLISPLTGTVNLNSQTLSGTATFSGAITFSSTVLFTTLDVGATDTTVSRSAAGILAVEGVAIPTISSSDALSNKTLIAPTISATGFTNANHAHIAANSGGTLSHNSATDNPASAVHGLPASTNVLGNRNASGEYVQRGVSSFATTSGDVSVHQAEAAITFAVAFNSTPYIVTGGSDHASANDMTGGRAASTTGFTMTRISMGGTVTAANCAWIALGT